MPQATLVLCAPWEVEEKKKLLQGRANQISYRTGIAGLGNYICDLEARCTVIEEKCLAIQNEYAEELKKINKRLDALALPHTAKIEKR